MQVSELVRVRPDAAHLSAIEWRSRMCAAVEGVEFTVDKSDISGEFLALDFAGARMYYLHSENQRVLRSRPSPKGRFAPMAVIQLEGECNVTQLGRRCELTSGTFCYIDAAAPLLFECQSVFKALYLRFPQRCFTPSQFQNAVGIRMGESGMDRLFYESATQVWNEGAELQPLEHSTALNALISLSSLTTALRCRDNDTATPIRVTRAMAFIENNLGESWLTPDTVAAAQNVSRRYLDDLFGQSGFRIERWIWERRLTRAMEELRLYGENCGHAKKSIIQIALDVGFKSPSHFSRSFNKRFGISPRQYKRQISLAAAA
jgi:AraC family transcriptional regulator, positive regulator of tynA and feaB